ncbi:hypothetical protein HMPREF3067_07875 [Corynebacterium sp. HMSC04H06]|nr:hypothetical protein HMPREF3067_07875 [Corynebacterium sp. HMSC04H06]
MAAQHHRQDVQQPDGGAEQLPDRGVGNVHHVVDGLGAVLRVAGELVGLGAVILVVVVKGAQAVQQLVAGDEEAAAEQEFAQLTAAAVGPVRADGRPGARHQVGAAEPVDGTDHLLQYPDWQARAGIRALAGQLEIAHRAGIIG